LISHLNLLAQPQDVILKKDWSTPFNLLDEMKPRSLLPLFSQKHWNYHSKQNLNNNNINFYRAIIYNLKMSLKIKENISNLNRMQNRIS
jgi:hypothetical protein